MKVKHKTKQLLSTFIMPVSLVIALLIMFVVYKTAGVNYYELTYDYKYFYVFSAPVILFFAGGFAIPEIWDKNNKKLSKILLAISFVLNAVITFGITAFDSLWYNLYLFNPYNYMSFEGLFDVFGTEYTAFFPIIWMIVFGFSAVCLVGVPLLGAYLFSTKKMLIKIPALCLIVASLITVGGIGINTYLNDSIFYDVKGNEYSNPYDVVYYDDNGKSYRIEEIDDYDFDHDACNVKVKAEDGSCEYYIGECYINEETGLMITDENCEIIVALTEAENDEMEEKSFEDDSYIQIYKDRNGNKYRQIANALYDKNGKLLKKYRFRINSTYYQLRKDANADIDFYHYDLKGNSYVHGETIVFYDAEDNTYINQHHDWTNYNSNYDIYDKDGKKIGSIDGWDCLIDIKTGLLVIADYEYNVDTKYYEDKRTNKYQQLNETSYDKYGKVGKVQFLSENYDW